MANPGVYGRRSWKALEASVVSEVIDKDQDDWRRDSDDLWSIPGSRGKYRLWTTQKMLKEFGPVREGRL